MAELAEKQKMIFDDIVSSHSPKVLKSKLVNGAQVVQAGLETGGDEGMEILILGVDMLNQAISRYELLKQIGSCAEVLHGK